MPYPAAIASAPRRMPIAVAGHGCPDSRRMTIPTLAAWQTAATIGHRCATRGSRNSYGRLHVREVEDLDTGWSCRPALDLRRPRAISSRTRTILVPRGSRRPPWAHGPAEVFRHADEHFRQDGDTDRRLALIGFDNAIEVCVDTFVGLHPRHRGGYEIRREDREPILRTYHTKVEFLERYAAEQGASLGDASIDRRRLVPPAPKRALSLRKRNDTGAATSWPPSAKPRAVSFEPYSTARSRQHRATPAKSSDMVPETPPDSSSSLAFLGTYIRLERAVTACFKSSRSHYLPQLWHEYRNASPWAREYDGLVERARSVRNTLAHGRDRTELGLTDDEIEHLTTRLSSLTDLIADRPPGPVGQQSREGEVVGRALARAAYKTAMAADPERGGLTTLEIIDLLLADGVRIKGDDPSRTTYDALNGTHDLFRASRSRKVQMAVRGCIRRWHVWRSADRGCPSRTGLARQ